MSATRSDRASKGRAFMFQGTGSSVGKSLLVAGLARAFTARGLKVLPFKPQNMSNNAAVTHDGGEIGRAQALQARAAQAAPSVHMNPVLLKPQTDTGAQIIVQGKLWKTARGRAYQKLKPELMTPVLDSFEKLKNDADLVLVEGAGSASEVNLRANDIANMGFARAADVPVAVIGDIDRGGVIAALIGTHAVLDAQDRAMIEGFVINRMRGDLSLFDDGRRVIANHTGWHDLGLVPYFPNADKLPAEDALDLADRMAAPRAPTGGVGRPLRIAVPVLPRIANTDDLDPLAAEPDVELIFVKPGEAIPACDLIILPGSKTTIADLTALREQGWNIDIAAHHRRGGHVLGLCGGYQMLGRVIRDPHGIEGKPGEVKGLGLLDIETDLTRTKRLESVTGVTVPDEIAFSGYEMHMGVTTGGDTARPAMRLSSGRNDGAISPDGRVIGTYAHGFFAMAAQRKAWLERFGGAGTDNDYSAIIDTVLDDLADHLGRHMALDKILSLAR